MSILPKNELQKTVDTPKNFFIYGETMSGKSYLAGEFPNPLFLDTDGNASANPYPSIELRNVRGKDGHIENSILDQLDEILLELETADHTYETIVLDVIDDIVVMIEQYLCDREGVETLGDIPFGKGYAAFKSIFNKLVIDLKTLPLNVIYISRITTVTEDNVKKEYPSLAEKHVNVVNGNCDYMIQTKKIGKNYIRVVKKKRKNYDREKVDDDRILKILDTITGAFDRSQSTSKKRQDEIVKQLDDSEEEKITPKPKEEKETSQKARKKPQI
ncbi:MULTISPECIES: AAA family ATPase [Aerococcus]|uniref:Alpha/beta hydrolase n=6 Tax=Bacteria TaxID=2 RepID=A0A329NRX0_9LACT|nr:MULTISPECIES: AAA family ATPase [Aerococcus]KAA9242193.1 AAA family ATPase [Aerococcus urinae]KAA9298674.1 AAA family ATPase [Aerococcus tenax]MCY3026194.1 ATP-binding protein [Aerococcus loyolae]MCY3035194.1 ATP-binding protein [Aerococcus mictus]MCY3064221.1 ATP-binding protein [Aerococcus mictus]